MVEHIQKEHVLPYRTYILIWLCLVTLTGITVWIAGLQLGRFSVLVTLLVASLKASLVLYFFMHLKYEERLIKIVLFVVVVTLAVIIGLTFVDVGFR